MPGKEVEKYKLSPNFVKWLKAYKAFKAIEAYARGMGAVKQKELLDISQLWTVAASATQSMREKFPSAPLRGMHGMEDVNEDQEANANQNLIISY